MQTIENFNIQPTRANVNNLMQRVLDDMDYNEKHNVKDTLVNIINRNLRELAQIIDEKELTEIKQYEFSCEIELYPMVQYVDANTAEEAMEKMEQIIEDESFLHDLDTRDFHCTSANIVKETNEFKAWRNSTGKFQEDK